MDWNDIRLFLKVAESGSFTAAAKGGPRSAVSIARRISAMENDLGVKLFLRGTGGITLTMQGQLLLEKAKPTKPHLEDVIEAARSLKTRGWLKPIRISGTEPVIAEMVAPHVAGILQTDPQLRLELNVSNDVVSLSEHGAEIALRFGQPIGNSLKVRRVAQFSFAFYRASEYQEPFEQAAFVGYDDTYGDIPELRWMVEQGLMQRMTLRSSSTRAILNAARSGAGLALLPRCIAENHPGLVEDPYPVSLPNRDLWMLTHKDTARVTEIRAVTQWLSQVLKRSWK